MEVLDYYYLHPNTPQYFFPEGFQQHSIMLSFYMPYTLKGRLSLALFSNFSIYRNCFKLNDIDEYVPAAIIREAVGHSALLAFNKGTEGPEQKTTVIGYDSGEYFFCKYAQNNVAKDNVKNEARALELVSNRVDTPGVLGLYECSEGVLLKTEVLRGVRLSDTRLSEQVVALIDSIVDVKGLTEINDGSGLYYTYAHGDFCPWNIMKVENALYVYDWELAGDKPLGYDLFTYIFQVSFLLSPNESISLIIEKNKQAITAFFSRYDLSWQPYLLGFAEIKYSYELSKNNEALYPFYKSLIDYARRF